MTNRSRYEYVYRNLYHHPPRAETKRSWIFVTFGNIMWSTMGVITSGSDQGCRPGLRCEECDTVTYHTPLIVLNNPTSSQYQETNADLLWHLPPQETRDVLNECMKRDTSSLKIESRDDLLGEYVSGQAIAGGMCSGACESRAHDRGYLLSTCTEKGQISFGGCFLRCDRERIA